MQPWCKPLADREKSVYDDGTHFMIGEIAMAFQTWKQLGEAADIDDCRMESVLTMGRLCRRLQPRFESQTRTNEESDPERVCMLCGRSSEETEYMLQGLRIGVKTGQICKECVGVYSAYLASKARVAGL